jgi:hypothetical protein
MVIDSVRRSRNLFGNLANHMHARSRVSRCAILPILVFMLVISLILPVLENLAANTDIDVGGTHYDAGEDWLELHVSFAHSGNAGRPAAEDSKGCSLDSCDADMDGEWLPVNQIHRVFFDSTAIFCENKPHNSPPPVFSLYKPPKAS